MQINKIIIPLIFFSLGYSVASLTKNSVDYSKTPQNISNQNSINYSKIPQNINSQNCILNHFCFDLPNKDIVVIDVHSYIAAIDNSLVQSTTSGIESKSGEQYTLVIRERNPELIVDFLNQKGDIVKTIFPNSRTR